jgi:hypothetical protein
MPTRNTYSKQPDFSTASAATAIVMAALLPLAVAFHMSLRLAVASKQPPARFDRAGIPVLRDRVAAARSELLDVATVLKHSHAPDPASVALRRELLGDGSSPLSNPHIPAADLHATLSRARAGLAAQPPA